jgi:hypothetical protein
VPTDGEESLTTETALDAAYDDGVRAAEDFIDRHPYGWPDVVMSQGRKPTWSTNELDKKYQDGWFERLGREVGAEGAPTESWRVKMQSLGQWPDQVE